MREPIHGVVVSDGFSDYLDIALSHSRPLLGHCVVVTSGDDKESQRVAGKHDCTLVVTEDGRQAGGFNKGRMIERGLQQLPSSGWRVHFDADICLPGNAARRLETALCDRACIYGCDRMNVVGWEAYQRLLGSGFATRGFEHHHFLSYSIDRAEIGSRLIYGEQGWVPIGFFQLWHAGAEYSGIYRTRPYATGAASAAHDDVQFALRWDRRHRVLIPEFLAAHLVTEDSSYGANWQGRKTRRFGPPGPRKPDPQGRGY
jgi:hypothetical protein